jgi:hypothetical protein
MKFKQLNKQAWKREDEVILYRMGKAKSLVADVFKSITNRDEKSITNKLWHMGFNIRDGRIL